MHFFSVHENQAVVDKSPTKSEKKMASSSGMKAGRALRGECLKTRRAPLAVTSGTRGRWAERAPSHVTCALTKERKGEVITKLKSELETSTAVVGFTFKGVAVPDMEKLRGDIPDDASLVVAKNTLMRRAAEEVEGWSEVTQFCTGSNAFLFLREDLKTGFKVRDRDPPSEPLSLSLSLRLSFSRSPWGPTCQASETRHNVRD